jgi:hypothetical protein
MDKWFHFSKEVDAKPITAGWIKLPEVAERLLAIEEELKNVKELVLCGRVTPKPSTCGMCKWYAVVEPETPLGKGFLSVCTYNWLNDKKPAVYLTIVRGTCPSCGSFEVK